MVDNNKMKILIVDDNAANIDVLIKILEGKGYNLAMATSGEKAIKIANHFIPDLILLDIMMPEMDGFETCAQLKKEKRTKEIPVIFVTAKKGTQDIVKGFRLGGVDYISKPFRQEEILARVKTHIKLRRLIIRQTTLITEYREALSKIKTLSGLLPICASCKKIRDDDGYWHQIEEYISTHSDADFSHSICMDCAKKLYPEYVKD